MDIWRKWRNPRQKPPFGARIDWSDPITEELVGCWLFNESLGRPFDLGCYEVMSLSTPFSYKGEFIDCGFNKYFSSEKHKKLKLLGDVTVVTAGVFDVSTDWYPILAVEGGTGETEAENALIYLCYYGGILRQIHEYGAGNNENIDSGYQFSKLSAHSTIVLRRDVSRKIYVFDINGYNKTVSYINQPTNTGDGCYLTIGSRSGGTFAGAVNALVTHLFIFERFLLDSEAERLYYEPYSFFLVPAGRLFDLAPASGGQTYFYEGNIPLSLLPSHAKEVRYYLPLGGAPIVLTPQGQVRASYQKEGSQQINLTPQADIKATYVKDGSVLMQIALAAEKQARYFAAGEIPINLQVQGEKKALYQKSGALSFSLLPFSRVQATYAKEGSVSFSLALESDIACTFRVEGSVGFILLPQGNWTYIPATGGVVYAYEGNIPIALAPEADVKALYKKQGGLFLSLSPASSWQAKYRHVGELLLNLVPAGEKQVSFLIEGEIQLHLVPEGVAVVIKPSGQEELFVVGIIEEDDLRAVFDGAIHGEIWPRK